MVVDVGSYIGVDLVTFLRHAPVNVAVHTFEPVPEYRTKLASRVKRLVKDDSASRLHVHAYGLGKSNHTACFSTKAASTDEVRTGCSVPADIRDAAESLAMLPRVDVMQLNCEGCEYDVLERLLEDGRALSGGEQLLEDGRALSGGVYSFEVQFHLDWGVQNDTARYCRIETGLRAHGFRLDYRHPFLWERWTRREYG